MNFKRSVADDRQYAQEASPRSPVHEDTRQLAADPPASG